MDYSGLLYRALNPLFASDPLSGYGAALHGGRYNPRGMPALYLSLSPVTALREANQAGSLQPTTLVSYDAELTDLFDMRDAAALPAFGLEDAFESSSWRDEMRDRGEARTQRLARMLIEAGHPGLVSRSLAPGSGSDDLNIVLWRWDGSGARIAPIDDEGRLRRL